MPRRRNNTCPPGVFCIENTTIFFLLLLAVIFLVVAVKYINKLVFNNNTQTSSSFNYLAKYFPMPVTSREHYITMPKMGAGISNNPRDILNNLTFHHLEMVDIFLKIVVIREEYL